MQDFLTGPEVCQRFRISRSTLARWIARGFFPKPVRIGSRTNRFRSQDVEAVGNCLPHTIGGGAFESGWILEQPDVDPEQLVNRLDDDCASAGELQEAQLEAMERTLRERYPKRGELI
jgi:predicted DNA-binding transcriptional regulator AlpA